MKRNKQKQTDPVSTVAQWSHECVSVLRFSVLIEILKPDKPDPTVSLKGLEFIDVPALAKRDYKMSFFAFREGQYHTKVRSHALPCAQIWIYVLALSSHHSPTRLRR